MRDKFSTDAVCAVILEKWPQQMQRLKAIEELNECAARLAKDAVNGHVPVPEEAKFSETVGEIADATIMLRQMRLMYGWEAVDAAIEFKLDRTLGYLGVAR